MTTMRDLLVKILPSRIVEPVSIYRQHLAVNRTHAALCTISQEIQPELIKNLRILPDRLAMLEMMPRGAVVAEVGVAEGGFSESILQICKPAILHLVDLWSSDLKETSYNECAYATVKGRFAGEIDAGRVVLHRGLSWEALGAFPDNYFDWVYIDASHAYESVKQDLAAAKRKLKASGIIAGHDYTLWGDSLSRWGVIEAVNEFCNANDFEMVYLTHESKRNHSYAIRGLAARKASSGRDAEECGRPLRRPPFP